MVISMIGSNGGLVNAIGIKCGSHYQIDPSEMVIPLPHALFVPDQGDLYP